MSVEDLKRASGHLRGELRADLASGSAAFEHEASTSLLKFHGIYQQDDRDVRRERAAKKLPLDYSCMVRSSIPGGEVTAAQWLALDGVADLADGTMRLTTRQDVQFHVVRKGDLRELVHGINATLLTTIAACGDVVRNTMACPWPDERQLVLRPLLDALVRRFRPRTTAYWELWIDGERAVSAEPPELPLAVRSTPDPSGVAEPIYGDAYLPRKFKIAVAWPGCNCVDVYSNDVGLVPTLSGGPTGAVTGFQIFVGGGMGMSHAREHDTYPRLASPLGWVEADRVVDAVEAIVTAQRDHGNRDDRQQARLKYLVDLRGSDWFRAEVERRLGAPLEPSVELPVWEPDEHHGTHLLADDAVAALGAAGPGLIGLPVPSGKVADRDGWRLRTALRELAADGTVGRFRVTARQDLLLCDIATDRLDEVRQRLRDHGVALADDVSPLRRLAIACPALPTCGQALGEAERVLPSLVDQLEKTLSDAGHTALPVRLNMTGCPNGCARPYNAEIGIVGRGKRTYDVYVGGAPAFGRLGRRLRADVPFDQLAATLLPLFEHYPGDAAFGDWAAAQDPAVVETWLPAPTVRRRAPR